MAINTRFAALISLFILRGWSASNFLGPQLYKTKSNFNQIRLRNENDTTPNGTITFPIDVGNYSARFSFGSLGDATNLKLSTQSDWTYVMSTDCAECP